MGEEISMVIMLYSTNIIGLVGSDNNVHRKHTKLIIWDDNQKKPLGELIFNQKIMSVKLRKDKIVVVLNYKIYVYDLNTFKNIDIIETGDNSHGIVGISYAPDQTLIAYPDIKKGQVRIKNYEKSSAFYINAHDNTIAYIALSFDGSLLATASEEGRLIRIFNSENGNLLQEVRRGKDKADIKFICFELSNKFIAASSNKGTVHIWSLLHTLKNLNKTCGNYNDNMIGNKTSRFKWLPSFLGGNYFSSEWSFSQVRITDQNSICCFGADNTIIIVSTEGKYYKAQIDIEKGGDCKIIHEEYLI